MIGEGSSKIEDFRVEIDRNRCEGKAACAAVCPNAVFAISRIKDEEFAQLSLLGRLKSRVHGRRTAYVIRGQDCTGCEKCVIACPEGAIHVTRRET